jgi:hypothetical protein
LLTDDFLQSLGFVHAGSKENAPDGAKWMYIGDSHTIYILNGFKFVKRAHFSNELEPFSVCNIDLLRCQMRECWQYEKYAQQIECEIDLLRCQMRECWQYEKYAQQIECEYD